MFLALQPSLLILQFFVSSLEALELVGTSGTYAYSGQLASRAFLGDFSRCLSGGG
jgi:hypothetical protein